VQNGPYTREVRGFRGEWTSSSLGNSSSKPREKSPSSLPGLEDFQALRPSATRSLVPDPVPARIPTVHAVKLPCHSAAIYASGSMVSLCPGRGFGRLQVLFSSAGSRLQDMSYGRAQNTPPAGTPVGPDPSPYRGTTLTFPLALWYRCIIQVGRPDLFFFF
jgi:hypothetical protein